MADHEAYLPAEELGAIDAWWRAVLRVEAREDVVAGVAAVSAVEEARAGAQALAGS